ncbi:helix-turn-helix domain-containing protein [Priestia endophytica]|uniref:helix-turn-helix domain-containing protein n=1 Tax=Priestia endophytica TaxID=135735 RepID=UPI0011594FCB|nr:helix-turn-helix domain-containing protein [Priestia endophytica]
MIKRFNSIPQGYIGSRDASKELGISQSYVNQCCEDGRLKGSIKIFLGKQIRWIIPKKAIEKVVKQQNDISKYYFTVEQLSEILGIHRVTVTAYLNREKIQFKEGFILNSLYKYIDRNCPEIQELLTKKRYIDTRDFITRQEAAELLKEQESVLIYQERTKLKKDETFVFFGTAYIRREAIERMLKKKQKRVGYLTSKEAASKINLSPSTLTSYCIEGKIDGAFKEGGRWFIPNNYVNRMGNKYGEFETEYMTLNQFAEKMGVSWKVVKTRIKNGKIPEFQFIENHWFIPIDSVSKYEDNIHWLQRKSSAKKHNEKYYSKDLIFEALKKQIVDIKKPHLEEITNLFIEYCKDKIGKTVSKGYKLKSFSTDLYHIYEQVIILFPEDISAHTSEQLPSIMNKTKASARIQRAFSTFIKFAFAQKDITPTKSIQVHRKSNKSIENDLSPYTPELYHSFNTYARKLEQHIPRACRSANYANMWVYVLLHLTDVWRHTDMIEKFPTINLEHIGVNQHIWFKKNRLTQGQCQKVINELYLKLRPEVTNKTGTYLTFLVEPTLVECLAHAVIISEIHRRRADAKRLLFTFVVRSQVSGTVNKNHLTFFDQDPKLKVFRNQKMNRSTMTYFHYHIVEKDADNADVALTLPKKVRSHKEDATTAQYIKAMNKDGSINNVSLNLFQRGHFGWLYNYMIVLASQNQSIAQSMTIRTELIQTMRKDLSPKDLEEWAEYLIELQSKRKSVINELTRMDKEKLVYLIRRIFNQEMPSRTNPGQCIVYPKCSYPSRKNCFGCEFFVPQHYVLIEAANEFKRVIEVMKKARYETTFIRDKRILFTILTIIEEAKRAYPLDQLNEFISLKDVKKGIQGLRDISFVE